MEVEDNEEDFKFNNLIRENDEDEQTENKC